MKILITAGSTSVMIDQVRCISNIFKGRTGAEIARYFWSEVSGSNQITLITSNPKYFGSDDIVRGINILPYKTYDELYALMEKEITTGNYDIIIHSAAVSDYKVEGTYCIQNELSNDYTISGDSGSIQILYWKLDASSKISSANDELYLKLVPTEKIIDKIRDPWGFKGKLVKFKLQVGISDEELIEIASRSRRHSKADLIVANCLEWSNDHAFIIKDDKDGNDYISRCSREDLPAKLAWYLG